MVKSARKESGPVKATVDHADIRGLATTLHFSVRCLLLTRDEGPGRPLNAIEGCTDTGAAPLSEHCSKTIVLFYLGSGFTKEFVSNASHGSIHT